MASGESSQSSRVPPPRPTPPAKILYKRFQKLFKTSLQLANEGIVFDEIGKANDAINMYTMCLEHIKFSLDVDLDDQYLSTDEQTSYRDMLHKLTKTKMQVESRLDMLNVVNNTATDSNSNVMSPPSYEEVMSGSFVGAQDGATASRNTHCANRRVSQNATRIFFIPEGVQLLYITPEGYVTAPSYPTALNIYRIDEEDTSETANTTPPAFLQVGEWLYPLLPGISPVLHASYGAYIFPDMLAPREGCSVGLILPKSLSPEEKKEFEDLLSNLTHLERQPRAERPRVLDLGEKSISQEEEEKTSTKVAKGIEKVAELIAWGLGKGAEHGTALLKKGSEQIISHISPAQRKAVDPTAQKSAEYLRYATHSAVRVSGYALSKLGDATMAFGRILAPHLKEQGKKILPKSITNSSEAASNFDAAIEIASSGIKGFSTVYIGLEAAAKFLARGLANETVHIVNHKYGTDMAKTTENTLYSVGNVAMTTNNVTNFGAKALAKRVVKDAGKAVIIEHSDKPLSNPGSDTDSDAKSPSHETTKKSPLE
ncbi:spartin [Octopus bimaculoides]|uniref:Senescence domain-containing protein n=1 Tax=Octopus bimaculoides TaxID=37653 RepID=A0A0L8HSB3_OCTBM|nr:spartin [Octopus bimaculoides]XP_014769842.1 spartin [Octopus bimaculoides]|eukprot:XP_014769840.1 PREDICTED: spartin-like [Octopus bimaculoides]